VIAHRGAPGAGARENTVRAFREAAAAGADGVEMDVRLTKDGRLAVFHDAATEKGGKRVPVRALAYEELRDPTVEAHDRVPTLEEAVRALLGRTGVIVEVKEADAGGKVASALLSLKADERLKWLLLASFHPDALRAAARAAPGIRRALVVSGSGPGLAGWLRGRMPLGAWKSSGAQDLMPEASLATRALVQGVGARHGRVIPWTVNDPDDAVRLVEIGCAGVISDSPAEARRALRHG
jgi:glycerophosphoryl diester phosphodiesterase